MPDRDHVREQSRRSTLWDSDSADVFQFAEELKQDGVKKMIDALNQALKADRLAIFFLLSSRYFSKGMVEDPHMICDGRGKIGMLGILNGCLDAAGMPKIGIKWKNNEETPENMEEFVIYDPPKR